MITIVNSFQLRNTKGGQRISFVKRVTKQEGAVHAQLWNHPRKQTEICKTVY